MLTQYGNIIRSSAKVNKKHHGTQVTRATYSTSSDLSQSTLSSGVKVISLNVKSPVSTLSLFVKGGSRYESNETIGSTHFLKHFGFKGTRNKSAIRLVRDLEYIGASYHTEISRENIGYHLQALNQDSNLALLAETLRALLEPKLHEFEVDKIRKIPRRESSEIERCPETSLLEILHSEAFPDNGLRNRLFIAPYALEEVDPLALAQHVKSSFFPVDARVSIVGSGFEHETLLKALEPLFGNLPEFDVAPVNDKSKFVGGKVTRVHGPTSHTNLLLS